MRQPSFSKAAQANRENGSDTPPGPAAGRTLSASLRDACVAAATAAALLNAPGPRCTRRKARRQARCGAYLCVGRSP
jgi:hypothetical protein